MSSELGFGFTITLNDMFSQTLAKLNSGFNNVEEKSQTFADSFAKMGLMKAGVDALAGAVEQFTEPFLALDKQVKNIGTLGVQNFEEFAGLATELSKTVPDSAAQIAAGVYDAVSSGITGTNQEILKFVEANSKAAVAGLTDTATAVRTSTQLIAAYGLESKNVGDVNSAVFGAINTGVFTYEQLAGAMSNVSGTAAGLGVSLEETLGLLAQQTYMGKPFAQATTTLRQAMIEVQKPGKDLAAIMANVGLTAGNVADQVKKNGLAATLELISAEAVKQGKSMNQVFSSSEAASAMMDLTGKNFQNTLNKIADVNKSVTTNAAERAYQIAAQGLDVRLKIIGNKIQGFFNDVFMTVGDGAVIALESFNRFAPSLIAFQPVLSALSNGATGAFGAFQKWNATFATGTPLITKLTATLRMGATSFAAFGASVWASLAPLLPFIAAAAAVAGAIYFVVESMDAFQAAALSGQVAEGGLLGFMQKVGGVFTGLKEIFSSLSSEGFALSENVAAALERMGLLNFVVALGTYAVRIREFFAGAFGEIGTIFGEIGAVFTPLFETFSFVIEMLGAALKPVFAAFSGFSVVLGNTTSGLEGWALAGRLVVQALTLTIRPLIWVAQLTANFIKYAVIGFAAIVSATIAVGQAFYSYVVQPIVSALQYVGGLWYNYVLTPYLAVVTYVGGLFNQYVVQAILAALQYVGGLVAGYLYDPIIGALELTYNYFAGWVQGFVGLGSSIVDYLITGLQTAWAGLSTMFLSLIEGLPGGSIILKALGGETTAAAQTGQPTAAAQPISQAQTALQTLGQQNVAQGSPTFNPSFNNSVNVAPANVVLQLDGEVIAKNVNDRNSFNSARQ